MRFFSLLIVLLFLFVTASAHVGSPEVLMEGTAGPYKLLVSVQPPDVIPGVAKVTVYLQNAAEVNMSLRAVYFRSGDEGSPEPDMMKTSSTGQYTGETWLMNGGSSSVQIVINGTLGKGELVVPVVALSTAKKEMPASTGWVLAALGLFLFILMVTIIGASVSDALTKRGETISATRKRMKIAGFATAAVLTSLVVYGGNAWWQSWASDYQRYMFRPTQATSVVTNVSGVNELRLTLDTSAQRRGSYTYVVPDHGKLMHMFVMRVPSMDAFAHLHPQRTDTASFRTVLPPLPAGKYIVFADIVYTTGFTETIRDTFQLNTALTDTAHQLDKDDAYAFAVPADVVDNPQLTNRQNTIVCGRPGTGVKLKDGSTMIWEEMTNEALESGKLYRMTFSILDPKNQPANLDPYLGMGGHAAVVRNDANVYVHLHPVGTFSMAAETNLVKRISDPRGVYRYPDGKQFRDSIDQYVAALNLMDEDQKERSLMTSMAMPQTNVDSTHGMKHPNTVTFPYSFPSPGQYRIWVQIKRNGQVLTGAFDRMVK